MAYAICACVCTHVYAYVTCACAIIFCTYVHTPVIYKFVYFFACAYVSTCAFTVFIHVHMYNCIYMRACVYTCDAFRSLMHCYRTHRSFQSLMHMNVHHILYVLVHARLDMHTFIYAYTDWQTCAYILYAQFYAHVGTWPYISAMCLCARLHTCMHVCIHTCAWVIYIYNAFYSCKRQDTHMHIYMCLPI